MQLGKIGRALFSGSIVYVIMVACSAPDGGGLWTADREDAGRGNAGGDARYPGDNGNGGDGKGGSAGGFLDAAVDAITDPVPDAAAAEDGTKDGSRLKARYYVSEDGAQQFATWFDTQRGEECAFQLAADGKRRCLPTAVIFGTPGYFADASCSQRLIVASTGCADHGLVAVWDTAGYCGGQYRQRIYPMTGKFTGATVYYETNGVCTAGAMGTMEFVRAGAEIPAGAFVSANIQ